MSEQKRDPATGKFLKGSKGGPGRPKRDTERGYLAAAIGAVSLPDWIVIVKKAAELAKNGDHRARAWLAEILLDRGELEARITTLEERMNRKEKP